jgi:DNA-binding transcriptional ArsR family regulator
VIGDPTRIRMLDRLRRGPAGVQEDLADATGSSQQNVSRHLTRLIERGFVACGRHGNEHHYRLIDPSPVQVLNLLSADLAGQLRRLADMIGHDTAAPGK